MIFSTVFSSVGRSRLEDIKKIDPGNMVIMISVWCKDWCDKDITEYERGETEKQLSGARHGLDSVILWSMESLTLNFKCITWLQPPKN